MDSCHLLDLKSEEVVLFVLGAGFAVLEGLMDELQLEGRAHLHALEDVLVSEEFVNGFCGKFRLKQLISMIDVCEVVFAQFSFFSLFRLLE